MKVTTRLLAPLLLALPAAAQTTLTFELVAEGLVDALDAGAPRGDERVFIAEHGGVIKVCIDGVVLPAPYLDISAKVPPPPQGEAGFLGFAFHPQYAANGYVYVYYTDLNFDSVIERYTVDAGDPDRADPSTATQILFIDQPTAYHNGGCIAFGPSGYLHIGLGDGGGLSPVGVDCVAQDISSPLGKILRIDVDGGFPYAIPPGNPFVGVPGAAEEVLHFGLRNPWRFGIDGESGDLFIGDVGAANWEELNFAPASTPGLNYGWPLNEAGICHSFENCDPPFPDCDDPSFTAPILTQSHATAPYACAMVGGEVYRGCALPELSGRYFFTDYCSSLIQSFDFDTVHGVQDLRDHTPELGAFYPSSSFITSFGTDGHGELLFVYQATPQFDAKVYRMVPANPPAGLVDCDANGFEDACEIAKDPTLDKDFDGVPDICQALSAGVDSISIAHGGTQQLFLHAGATHAGKVYAMAGSITGTDGIDLGHGLVAPLTFDNYTFFSLAHPDTLPLFDNIGVLDTAGDGLAEFTVTVGLLQPDMVGTQVYHAYVCLTPGAGVDFASNFIPVTLKP